MICSKIITPTFLNVKNFIKPVLRSQNNIYNFSKYKTPLPTDIDISNLSGL